MVFTVFSFLLYSAEKENMKLYIKCIQLTDNML